MENLVTIETITDWLNEQISNKQPVDASTWLDASQKINVLLQAEQEKLFEMEQKVSQKKFSILEEDHTSAYAKTFIEGTDDYKEARKQKAKIERCLELIRISKLQSRMASEIMRGN